MDQKFFWGAATSSHQVEGGNRNDWTEWEHRTAKRKVQMAKSKAWPNHIMSRYPNPLQEENYISGKACDHYNRFREDFDIAKSLGHNAHRFSIEWSRIEPEEGKFNEKEVEHYRKVIRALRERGLEPFVTLWHWTLPVWLAEKGGVLNKRFPEYFEKYVEKISPAMKDDVVFWVTFNEPDALAGGAYFKGIWPPTRKNIFAFWKARLQFIRAHHAGYQALKKVSATFRTGVVVNLVFFESTGGVFNNFIAWLGKRIWNFYVINRALPNLDFIGLNYYFHSRINYGQRNENKEISDMGWEIYPEGIYHILKDLKKYNLPVCVVENGIADARDVHRAKFIREHIEWMKKAMDEGVDVRGYFYWSLLDNFEWDKGFWPRFGLVEIDYKTLKRTIRPSALEYKRIITDNLRLTTNDAPSNNSKQTNQ